MYDYKLKKKREAEKDDGWKYVTGFFAVLFFIGAILNGCSTGPSSPQYPGDHDTQDMEYQADMMEQDTRQYDPGDAYVPDPSDNFPDPPGPGDASGLSASCDIKGNISMSGEKIYHTLGQDYYDATVIDESYGERWFCTEDEAVAAGWRKARN